MKKIIKGKDIVKTFGMGKEKTAALNGVNVEIEEGEFVAVMGPSGSGKTTLLFALSGTDTIDSGSVEFDGIELSELSENKLADIRRTSMGFVFQQSAMLKNLNLLDNIILPALQENGKNTGELTQRAKDLMHKTGIAGLEMRDTTEVSGGQLQRAGICRALISNPKIIFGDEPTGALNSKSAQEIMTILSEINISGTAIMLVTHDAKVAAQTERIMFMHDGKIVSEIRLPKFNGIDIDERMEKVTARMREFEI